MFLKEATEKLNAIRNNSTLFITSDMIANTISEL